MTLADGYVCGKERGVGKEKREQGKTGEKKVRGGDGGGGGTTTVFD